QDQYEFARGDNITLPCTFKSNVIITHYHPNGVTEIKPEYEGRVSVEANINGGTGKADLKPSSITTADNKKYECQVQNPKDNVGKDADTTTLTVLVAPSKPICKIEGTASYGQNVSLTCVSEEGSPPPTYKWNRYDVQNNSGAFPPKTTEKEGTLFLYNLTTETSGFYICTSANKIHSTSCNLTVTVLPPSMMNIGSTAGIIRGAVAALILLIVIIYCCCCRKKDNDKENYAMQLVLWGSGPNANRLMLTVIIYCLSIYDHSDHIFVQLFSKPLPPLTVLQIRLKYFPPDPKAVLYYCFCSWL
uniref:Cell surface A33 antigen-like n=1 Tax=Poecilia latipinna TaxID=48699 RepID=A0A3B3W2A0_9TELE